MREKSAWRALPTLRLLGLAAAFALICMILGATSASADNGAPAVGTLGSTTTVIKPVGAVRQQASIVPAPVSTVLKRASDVLKPVAVLKAVPGVPKVVSAVSQPVALLKAVPAVPKPVSAVLASVTVLAEPITSVVEHEGDELPILNVAVALEPIDRAIVTTMNPVVVGVASSQLTTVLASALRVDVSSVQNASGHVQPREFASPTSAPTKAPQFPVTAPWPGVTGEGATGTGFLGQGSAVADLTAGSHASAALLLGGLRHDSWVLPRSLVNDPSSSPD